MINKKIETTDKKQVDLAAETLAQIFIEQVINRKQTQINKKIENEYEQSN